MVANTQKLTLNRIGGVVHRRTSESRGGAAKASRPIKLVCASHVGVGTQATFKVTGGRSWAGVGEDSDVIDGNIIGPASARSSFKSNLRKRRR